MIESILIRELIKEIVSYLSMSQANHLTTFELFNNPLFPIVNSLSQVASAQTRAYVEAMQHIFNRIFYDKWV